jgi:putative MATE family efflux protein
MGVVRRPVRRDEHDREIFALAIPAFGALAAEPLYVLVDTAIVGRLGTNPLGGLAVAATVLIVAFGVPNFLAYSTTGSVARRIGADDHRGAVEHGIAGMWLAVAIGVVFAAAGMAAASVIVRAMGASDAVRPYAVTYLRISFLGAPFLLLALAGAGYQRGAQDTRVTFVIALLANAANLLIELLLVYGFDLGIAGSAWGTVIAQVGAAGAYIVLTTRAARRAHASPRPNWPAIRSTARIGGQLVIRTASLLLAFLVGTSVASRIGDVPLAAHQVAFQIWTFLALSMDAIAIAGQALVGRYLGANDAARARAAATRMLEIGVAVGIVFGVIVVALRTVLPTLFSDDQAVRNAAAMALFVVGITQPLNAIVFVLDGILIGAGDTAYLGRAMVLSTAVFLPAALLVRGLDRGLLALWGALTLLMVARAATMGRRYLGDAWLVTGASR